MRVILWSMVISIVWTAPSAWAERGSALQTNPSGWTDILPNQSLDGWTRVGIPPDLKLGPESQWKVPAGRSVLICEGDKEHEWLRYDRELANFILHVEWRFTKRKGGKGYNSGIMVRNSADGTIWHQAQTGSASGGFLFGDTLVKGEKKRVFLKPQDTRSRVKEAGKWNTFELRCEGKVISLWVNGAITSEMTEVEVPKGYLGLEAEGYRIEFRNLKLKELP